MEGCIRCRKVEQPWPFIDVYTTELHVKDGIDVTQSEDNDADHLAEIRYASEAARKKRPADAWRISKLYPLKACTFRGSARCRAGRPPAPHDSRDWLARVYGKPGRRRRGHRCTNYRTQKRNEASRFRCWTRTACRSATRPSRMEMGRAAGAAGPEFWRCARVLRSCCLCTP